MNNTYFFFVTTKGDKKIYLRIDQKDGTYTLSDKEKVLSTVEDPGLQPYWLNFQQVKFDLLQEVFPEGIKSDSIPFSEEDWKKECLSYQPYAYWYDNKTR